MQVIDYFETDELSAELLSPTDGETMPFVLRKVYPDGRETIELWGKRPEVELARFQRLKRALGAASFGT